MKIPHYGALTARNTSSTGLLPGIIRASRRARCARLIAFAVLLVSTRAVAQDTYDNRVAGFGANVVSYWKFENNGSDVKGVASATITGSPELNVDTIVDLDRIAEGATANGKVLAWPGTTSVYAQAPHNAAHKTANGTVVVTFQRDTTAAKAVLVAADANGTAERGLSIEVTAAGEPRAFLRNASTGAAMVVIGQPGDVAVNQAYTLILKWGTGGMSLALWNQSGTLVRRVTNAITTGVSGTSPIRFGAWHTGIDPHDGPFGRVVWLNRRITDTEEATLARARTIVRNVPSGLTAAVVGPNQINLTWTDNSPNETGFKIERKTGAGGTYAEIATVAAGATSYSNTGLTAATNYYYRVAAYNANGNSDHSNEVNATTLTDTYDNRVVGFGANVVSYWKFENTGTDQKSVATAVIAGAPELNVDTIVDLDRIVEGAAVNGKVLAWPGTSGVYAEAPHHAAHKTANGTVVVTFQRDAAATKSVLVAADANGTAERGLSIEVTATGEPRAFLRNASTGAAVVVLGQGGDVALHQAYTLILKWGAGGMSLALWNQSGTLVRRVTNAIATGVSGTSPIRFGAWHNGADAHDGPFGRVVWLNRRVTDAEEPTLARARTIVRGVPSGLTATVASHSQINLSWTDNSANETGFKIERKTGANGTYTQIATAAANATSFSSTGLVAGTTYYYRVRATNGNHDTAYSNDANATTADYVTTPEAHGWGAPGNSDIMNTVALQAAIDDASFNAGAGRGIVELVPGKTYTVGVSANGTSSSSPASALTARNNVEIRTAGSPTRASGNQAIIKWHSWASYADTSINHRVLLFVSNVSNFRCGYVQLHGNKNTMPSNKTMDYVTGLGDGGMNCVTLRHTISNVVLRELNVTHAGTDCFNASCDSALNVRMEDCNFSRGRRQGATIGRINPGGAPHDQFVFLRCTFNDTGDYPAVGEIVGQKPGYGVDVEPDSPTSSVYGVTFDDCDFTNNWGSNYLRATYEGGAAGYGLRFDCKSTVARFKLINSRGTGNTTRALSLTMRDDSVWDDILIENFVASGNAKGDSFQIGASGGDGTGGRITNARFINCNVTGIDWKAGDFPSPWDTGWSVTVWKGNFNPTVTPNGVSTVTVNNGFPP